jgi:hypothetical protein
MALQADSVKQAWFGKKQVRELRVSWLPAVFRERRKLWLP